MRKLLNPKYWSKNGKYQDKYFVIWANYIPTTGKCSNEYAELLRVFNKLYYDIFNNGLCNDCSSYVKHLKDNFSLFSSYYENSEQGELFMEFCETYLQEIQDEKDFDSSEIVTDCSSCNGSGHFVAGFDDDDGQHIEEECDDCAGSGSQYEYSVFEGTDWLGYYFSVEENLEMLDATIDAIILCCDAKIENKITENL